MPAHVESALRKQPHLHLKPEWVIHQFEPIFPVIPELITQINPKDLLIFRIDKNYFSDKHHATLIHHTDSIAPLPHIQLTDYCLQRIDNNFKPHHRVSFEKEEMLKKSWVSHQYIDENTEGIRSPIAHAPYSIHFSDGSKRSGRLNHDGFAQHDDIAAGPVRIIYAKTIADSQLDNKHFLAEHLNQQRQQFKNVLDKIIQRDRKRFKKQNHLLKQHSLVGQQWMLTRAYWSGVFSTIKSNTESIIHTWVTLQQDENTLAQDILSSIEQGRLQPLRDQLQCYCQRISHYWRTREKAIRILLTLCSDAATRKMLLDFVRRYFQVASNQDLAHMSGSASVQILLAIITGGESVSVDASKNAAECASAIERFHAWAERMSQTEHHIRTVRRSIIDLRTQNHYMQSVQHDLKKIKYVYRGISRDLYRHYKKSGKITDKSGGNHVYFALDVDHIMNEISPPSYKSLTQIKDLPEIILKIPVGEIEEINLPKPNWNQDIYGYEYLIRYKQRYGMGGLYQLFGKTNRFLDDWIIYGGDEK